jgi:hypothetical protein
LFCTVIYDLVRFPGNASQSEWIVDMDHPSISIDPVPSRFGLIPSVRRYGSNPGRGGGGKAWNGLISFRIESLSKQSFQVGPDFNPGQIIPSRMGRVPGRSSPNRTRPFLEVARLAPILAKI